MCHAKRAVPILMVLHMHTSPCGTPTGMGPLAGFVARTAASKGL